MSNYDNHITSNPNEVAEHEDEQVTELAKSQVYDEIEYLGDSFEDLITAVGESEYFMDFFINTAKGRQSSCEHTAKEVIKFETDALIEKRKAKLIAEKASYNRRQDDEASLMEHRYAS